MDRSESNASTEQDRRRRVSDANLFYTRLQANRPRTIKTITDYVKYIEGLKDWFDEPLEPAVWDKISEYAGYPVEPTRPPTNHPAMTVDPVPAADTLVNTLDKGTSDSVVQWCLKVMDTLYDKSVITGVRLHHCEKDAANEGFDLDGCKRSGSYQDLPFQAVHGLATKTDAIEIVLRKSHLSSMECAMWRVALSAATFRFPGKDEASVADFDDAIEEARMAHLPKRDDADPRLAHIGLEIDARYYCIQTRESLEDIHDTQLEIWHLRNALERWREIKDNTDTDKTPSG